MKKFLSKIIGSVAILGFLLPFIASAQSTVALPPQPGHAGQFLQTNGLNLSWAAAGGGGTITGGGAIPQVTLWTGATSIGGDGNFTFDTALSRLLVGDAAGALFDLNPNTQQAALNVGTNGFIVNDLAGNTALDVNTSSKIVQLGDLDSTLNDTIFTTDATANTIVARVDNQFGVQSTVGQGSEAWFQVSPAGANVQLGDLSGLNNGTTLLLDDTAQTITGSARTAGVGSLLEVQQTLNELLYSNGVGGSWGIHSDNTGGGQLEIHADTETWIWPNADSTGTQALTSDGAGNLGWSTIGSGTIGGTVAATEVAYGSGVNTITSDSTFTRTPSNFAVQTLNGGNTAEIQIDANTPFFNIFSSDGTNTAGIGSGTTFLELTNNDGLGNSQTWLWPQTDSQPGDVLTTDGAGNLSFAAGGSVDTSNAISVSVATTTVLPGAPTYNNGVSGVGATLTRTGNGALGNIDGQPTIALDRILVKNQASAIQNGVYEITQIGDAGNPYILTRTTDSDLDTEFDDQVVVPTTGTTQANQIFGQTTETPLIGTDAIVYVTVTNTYVTQSVTGTQTNGNIPFWTNNPRQLNRGNSRLAVPGNTWLNSMLRLGGGTQGGRMVFRSGTNANNVFIGYNDATTANAFNFNNVSAGGEMRTSIAGTTSTATWYSNSGKRLEMGDSYLSFSPHGVAAGNTMEARFLELAAGGTNYVGFKAADTLGGNVIWTLPTTDSTGTQALVSNGSGTLSWATVASGNVTGSGTSPRIPYWSSATALTDDANFARIATQGITLYDTGAKFNTFINGGNTTGSGTDNVGIGRTALDSLTTGSLNVAIGKNAGTALNGGGTNILIGDDAGAALVSGSDNVFIGHLTGSVATSSGNVGVGNQVMSANVGGNDNTALGASALTTNISGNDNVAIGSQSLGSSTATGNTAVGNQSLFSNSSGSANTAVGNLSLASITTNSGSTAMGSQALWITTGSNNTGFGSSVGSTLTTGTGNTLIGQSANVSASSTTDAIALGRGATAASNEFALPDAITKWKFQGDSYTLPTAFPASNDQALVSSTAGVMTWGSIVTSGFYTPTLTGVSNVTATTAYDGQWTRIGNVVTVGVRVEIDPTIATLTEVGISLPVASNIAGLEGVSGTCADSAGLGMAGGVEGDATNDRGQLGYNASSATSESLYCTFVYTVI